MEFCQSEQMKRKKKAKCCIIGKSRSDWAGEKANVILKEAEGSNGGSSVSAAWQGAGKALPGFSCVVLACGVDKDKSKRELEVTIVYCSDTRNEEPVWKEMEKLGLVCLGQQSKSFWDCNLY